MTDSVNSRIVLFLVATFAASAPATAPAFAEATAGEAVTARSPAIDDPRAAWLDRYHEARQGSEQTERVTETYKVGPDGSLEVQNMSGDVHVRVGGANEIRVEAVKRVRSRGQEDAKAQLQRLFLDINQVGNRVEIKAMYPRGRMSGSVDFMISVPPSATVSIKTISGDIEITNVRGEVRADTVSGDVGVTGTPNIALAKTVSGTLTAKDISSTTALTLASVSGNVITTGMKVRALDVTTVSGDLLLNGLQVERLDAKAVSGNIEFAAPLARGGRYELQSHSGDVRIAVLNGAGFELDATTFSGSVRSDFPVTLRSDPDARDGRGRGRDSRTIRGSFGDGGAILSVRSFSGSVVIAKQ
jgi:DUF4097 and DUF4098 domain-containing protein YvlB